MTNHSHIIGASGLGTRTFLDSVIAEQSTGRMLVIVPGERLPESTEVRGPDTETHTSAEPETDQTVLDHESAESDE